MGGLHHGGKAAGHGTELETHVGNILTLSETQCGGVETQRVVVGGQQVAGQSAVIVQIGLERDLIVHALIIGASGDADGASGIGGDAIMPEEAVQSNIGGVGNTGEVIAHDLAGLHLIIAGLLDGDAR